MARFFLTLAFFLIANFGGSIEFSKSLVESSESGDVKSGKFEDKIGLLRSIKVADQKNDTLSLISSYLRLEKVYTELGQYDSAIAICYNRLKINKLRKNYKVLSDNFRALNTLLITNLESRAAEGLIDSCYQYALLSKDRLTIAVATINYGAYIAGSDKNEGLKYLNRAVRESEQLNDVTIYLYSRVQAAEVLILVDSFNRAKEYLVQALNKAIEYNEKNQRAHIYLTLGRIYIAERKISDAILTLHCAKVISENEPYTYYLPDIYQSISQAYRIINNVDSCFYYNDKATQAQQILVNEKTNIQVAEVNARYQLEGKQNAIIKLGGKLGAYKKAVWLIFALFIISVGFFAFYIFKLSQSSQISQLVRNQILKSVRKKESYISESLRINFDKVFIDQAVYVDHNLTLQKLAEQLNTNTAYLSRFINDEYKMNFSQLLNQYRVNKVCQLMNDKKFKNFTIEALAQDAGFKSKSTFNVAFKKQKGITPTQWRDNL